jgi:hypothetical protein
LPKKRRDFVEEVGLCERIKLRCRSSHSDPLDDEDVERLWIAGDADGIDDAELVVAAAGDDVAWVPDLRAEFDDSECFAFAGDELEVRHGW